MNTFTVDVKADYESELRIIGRNVRRNDESEKERFVARYVRLRSLQDALEAIGYDWSDDKVREVKNEISALLGSVDEAKVAQWFDEDE